MPMTPAEAQAVKREPIVMGESYEFYCDAQQEYEPPERRWRRFTGQQVTVLHAHVITDPDSSRLYEVRASDGTEFQAWEEELNGWDLDLGQFFWPDGTYGPDHADTFLGNERDPTPTESEN